MRRTHNPTRSAGHRWPARRAVCGVAVAAIIALVVAVTVIPHHGSSVTPAAERTPGCGSASSAAGGSALLGVNVSTKSQLSSATAEFGQLPVIRVYYTGMPDPDAWTTGVPARSRAAVVVSFRSPPATVLSGADDPALRHFFRTAPAGRLVYYSYYHEPEPLIENGTFTLTQYKAAWAHIASIADGANNACLVPTLILMSWDLNPASGVNWRDYLPAGHVIRNLSWDAYPVGTVHDQDPQPTLPAQFMGPAEAASRSVGLPFGFAEFALGTRTGRPQWLVAVASYLRRTGADFGTLFNSRGYPWMLINDAASIRAWRSAVAGSRPPASGS